MSIEFKKRPLSEAEASAFNEQRPESWEDYCCFREGRQVCDGPLVIEGDLLLEGQYLMVVGDLSCEVLTIDENSGLSVTGNLRAKSIVADGNVFILGGLEADDVYADSFCNRVFCCKGGATLRCLIEAGHSFEFNGHVKAKLVASLSNVVSMPAGSEIENDYTGGMNDALRAATFADSVLEDGEMKKRLVIEQILAKRDILR